MVKAPMLLTSGGLHCPDSNLHNKSHILWLHKKKRLCLAFSCLFTKALLRFCSVCLISCHYYCFSIILSSLFCIIGIVIAANCGKKQCSQMSTMSHCGITIVNLFIVACLIIIIVIVIATMNRTMTTHNNDKTGVCKIIGAFVVHCC